MSGLPSIRSLRQPTPALFTKGLCGRVFAIVRDRVFDLASQYAHDMDGVADHVGWALLAFRTSWH
jgi:hypothetical protein